MAKYKNIGGLHQLADGTNIPAGTTFETDQPIPEDFAAKFQQVFDAPEPVAPAPEPEPVAPEPTPEPEPDPALPGSDGDDPDLKDVTADFPLAGENDMHVVRGKRGWHIFDEGDEEPINDKPLLKRDVAPAIEAYLAD